MCLIVYKPKGVPFNFTHLREGFESNHDGAGVMFRSGQTIAVRRGFWEYDALEKFLKSYPQTPEMVVHFRWASHGKVNSQNCHPIPIAAKVPSEVKVNCLKAVAHNGIIHGISNTEVLATGKSDTVLFTEQFLSKVPLTQEVMDMVAATTRSRYMVMEAGRPTVLAGDFIFDEGIYYSNTSYLPLRRTSVQCFGGATSGWAVEPACVVCKINPAPDESGLCQECIEWWNSVESRDLGTKATQTSVVED